MAVSHTGSLLGHAVDRTDNIHLVFTRTHLAGNRESNLSSAIQGSEGNRRGVRRVVISNLDVNKSTVTVTESAQLVRVIHIRRQNESLVCIEGIKHTLKHFSLGFQVLLHIVQLIFLLLVDVVILIASHLLNLLIAHTRILLTLLSVLDIFLLRLGCNLHSTLLILLSLVRNLLVEVLLHGSLLIGLVFIPSLAASQTILRSLHLRSLHWLLQDGHVHLFYIGVVCKGVVAARLCTLLPNFLVESLSLQRQLGNLKVILTHFVESLNLVCIKLANLLQHLLLLRNSQQSHTPKQLACIGTSFAITNTATACNKILWVDSRQIIAITLFPSEWISHASIKVKMLCHILTNHLIAIFIGNIGNFHFVELTLLRRSSVGIK